MPEQTAGVLMVYLEPTPYIEGLVRELRRNYRGAIHVAYLGQNLSQDWNMTTGKEGTQLIGGGTLAAARELRVLLKTGRFALLHLAGWGTPALVLAILMGWAMGIPVCVESDTHNSISRAPWRRVLKRLVLPLLLKCPTHFLPGGSRQAAFLVRFGVSSQRMDLAQMTVDVTSMMAFARNVAANDRQAWRRRHGIGEDDTTLLYVGRLEPYKGLADLLDAFDMLRGEREDLKLLVVGEGSMMAELVAKSREITGLKLTGRLSKDELMSAYLAADVFVLPSLFEPWGLVVNEALACGLPVIASNRVGAVDDLVIHGETGLVFDPDEPHGLLDCLSSLLESPEARRRFGHAGREKIRDWTLENEACNVMEVWARAL